MSAEYSTGSAPVLWTEHLGRRVVGQSIVNDVSVEASLGPASGVFGAAALARGEDGEYVLGPSRRLA